MTRLLFQALGAIVLLAAVLYGGEDLSLRYRVPKSREPFGSVTVQPLYVIHQKNGKVEYQFAPPQDQPCVWALLPHFGYKPCWYLRRHAQQQIDI